MTKAIGFFSSLKRKNQLLNIKKKIATISKEFTFCHLSGKAFKSKIIRRISGIRVSEGITLSEYTNERISSSGVMFYPESLNYLFFLDGYKRQLLFYIIIHQMNRKNNEFFWNQSEYKTFCKYSKLQGDNRVQKKSTIDAAVKSLSQNNIIINLKRGLFMVNPMITCSNYKMRETLVNIYCKHLLRKNKCPDLDFYPKLNRKNNKSIKKAKKTDQL